YRAWDKEDNIMSVIDEIDFNAGYVLILTGYKGFEDIELMQSTGLKDKHGVEIFEGDIVKYDQVPNLFFANYNFEVTRSRTGEWRIDNYRGGSGLAFCNYKVKVIGNKYEHPHLLEE
ncbi:YopX family protein, partial [Staphylococcus xylosus]